MVSNMSPTSWARGGSNDSTRRAFWRSPGSPYMRTVRIAISVMSSLDLRLVAQHLHHGALGELDAHVVGDLERGLRVVEADDGADDAAGRHHAIAFLQVLQHLVRLLLALLLGPDQEEIENQEDRHELEQLEQQRQVGVVRLSARGGRLGQG